MPLIGLITKEIKKKNRVSKIVEGDTLMVNIGSMLKGARIMGVNKDMLRMQLISLEWISNRIPSLI